MSKGKDRPRSLADEIESWLVTTRDCIDVLPPTLVGEIQSELALIASGKRMLTPKKYNLAVLARLIYQRLPPEDRPTVETVRRALASRLERLRADIK